jgi:hypothetical protein
VSQDGSVTPLARGEEFKMRWLLIVLFALVYPAIAEAQQVNLYCYQGPTNPQWAPCASGNSLPVVIEGGGGGGLSVVDATGWTYSVSDFTPAGGEYNPSATALTSGQQGTVAMTAARAFEIDAINGSNLAALMAAPLPYYAVASYGTSPCTGYSAGANPTCGNEKGALFSSVVDWAGTTLGAATAWGTPPTGNVVGANVDVIPGTLALGATFVHGTTAAMTGTSSTQVVALVASQRLYITRIKCNNSSATSTLVSIQDGSGGTVLDTLAAGASYGGEQGTNPLPLFWTTAGNGLYAANVTTGASVICTASGYSG